MNARTRNFVNGAIVAGAVALGTLGFASTANAVEHPKTVSSITVKVPECDSASYTLAAIARHDVNTVLNTDKKYIAKIESLQRSAQEVNQPNSISQVAAHSALVNCQRYITALNSYTTVADENSDKVLLGFFFGAVGVAGTLFLTALALSKDGK